MNLSHVLKIIGSNGNQLFGSGNVGGVAFTSVAGELLDKLWVLRYRRNGNVTPETMRANAGITPPFHHLVDPTTVASRFTLIWENMVQGAVALGSCRIICGFCSWVTAGDATTLTGIGFYADAADNLWHCFVIDSATGVAPYVSKRDTATAVLCTSIHRMKFVIDGPTKTIKWYIDNTLADTFTPAAPLERMDSNVAPLYGPNIVYGAFVPASGDVSVRGYAGSLPLIRLMVSATPALTPTPGSSGMHMHASVT